MMNLDDAQVGRIEDAVSVARQLATEAHAGQVDKVGEPYINHPARVAARSARAGVEAEAAGWVHDVVEDTTVTLDELRVAGLSESVVAAVDALTRRDGEAPEEYYRRVAGDRLARIVKCADLADNSNPRRLARLDADTRNRLQAKYDHARTRTLLGALFETGV